MSSSPSRSGDEEMTDRERSDAISPFSSSSSLSSGIETRIVTVSTLNTSKKLVYTTQEPLKSLFDAFCSRIGIVDSVVKSLFGLGQIRVTSENVVSSSSYSWSGAEEIVWLSLESPASLQVVPVDYERPFVFRQLIQKLPREVDDPIALELLYTEHKHRVLSGVYVCSERIAVRLAVLALQESFGSFNPYLHRRGFMEGVGLGSFLPRSVSQHDFMYWQERLFRLLRTYRGMDQKVAQMEYIRVAHATPLAGVEWIPGRLNVAPFLQIGHETGKELVEDILLGVCEDGILVFLQFMLPDSLTTPFQRYRKPEQVSKEVLEVIGTKKEPLLYLPIRSIKLVSATGRSREGSVFSSPHHIEDNIHLLQSKRKVGFETIFFKKDALMPHLLPAYGRTSQTNDRSRRSFSVESSSCALLLPDTCSIHFELFDASHPPLILHLVGMYHALGGDELATLRSNGTCMIPHVATHELHSDLFILNRGLRKFLFQFSSRTEFLKSLYLDEVLIEKLVPCLSFCESIDECIDRIGVFSEVNVAGGGLDDDDMYAVCNSVAKAKKFDGPIVDSWDEDMNIISLVASRNNLTVSIVPVLSKFFAIQSGFQKLDFARNSLGDVGVQMFAAACSSCTSLSDLDLSWNSISDSSFPILIEGLSFCPIRRLALNGNGLTVSSMQIFGKSLSDLEFPCIEIIEVDDNFLGDEGCKTLLDPLASVSTIQTVSLCGNGIMSDDSLAKLVTKSKSLKTFRISRNPLTSEGCLSLGASLFTSSCLTEIELDNCLLGIQRKSSPSSDKKGSPPSSKKGSLQPNRLPHDLREMGLHRDADVFRRVNLSDGDLECADPISLRVLLSFLSSPTTSLRRCSLCSNRFDDTHFPGIFAEFITSPGVVIEEIDLSNNWLGMMAGAKENDGSISSPFAEDTQLQYIHPSNLRKSSPSDTDHIEDGVIDSGSNSVTLLESPEESTLSGGLLPSFSHSFSENSSIRSLSLSNCHIGESGCKDLFLSFSMNSYLTKLDLSGSDIHHSVHDLCRWLSSPPQDSSQRLLHERERSAVCNLKSLNLSQCVITDSILHEIARSVAQNRSLEYINLQGNGFTGKDIEDICNLFQKNPILLEVDLRDNTIFRKEEVFQLLRRCASPLGAIITL